MRTTAIQGLQRTCGNAAVARILRESDRSIGQTPASTIQRYTKFPAGMNWGGTGAAMRVSDDGNMAVKDSDVYPEGQGRALQVFYATPGVITQAKAKLLENGSLYDVHQGAEIDAPTPAPNGEQRRLFAVEVENKMLAVRGANVGTALNCSENTGQVMGACDLTQAMADQPQLGGKMKQGGVDVVDEIGVTNFGNPSRQRAQGLMTGKNTPTKAQQAYEKMSDKKKAEKAEAIGVNQAAVAHAGEGYGIWAKYGSHFAPVIAESGGDQVTLEAHFQSQAQNFPGLAPGSATFNNPEWYFRMYGSVKSDPEGKIVEDQTFYGEYEEAANRGKTKKEKDRTVFVLAFTALNRPLTAHQASAQRVALGKTAARDLTGAATYLLTQPVTQGKQGVAAVANQLRQDENTVPPNGNGVATLVTQWLQQTDTLLQGITAVTIPDNTARSVTVKKVEGQIRRLRRVLVHLQHVDSLEQ